MEFKIHDDVIKWKHFPRYWPLVRGIHRSPVNSPHKGQWRGALMFSLICAWIKGWVNNGQAGDLRPYRAHYDVSVMSSVAQPVGVYTSSKIGSNEIVFTYCEQDSFGHFWSSSKYYIFVVHIKGKMYFLLLLIPLSITDNVSNKLIHYFFTDIL